MPVESSTPTHQILVATTTPAIGAGIATWLSGVGPNWHVAGVVSSRADLIAHLKSGLSLVVVSASLGGVPVVADLARMRRRVPLLVLVSEPDAGREANFLRAGAMAVLRVRASQEELVCTARELIAGRAVASVEAIRLLADSPRTEPSLSARLASLVVPETTPGSSGSSGG